MNRLMRLILKEEKRNNAQRQSRKNGKSSAKARECSLFLLAAISQERRNIDMIKMTDVPFIFIMSGIDTFHSKFDRLALTESFISRGYSSLLSLAVSSRIRIVIHDTPLDPKEEHLKARCSPRYNAIEMKLAQCVLCFCRIRNKWSSVPNPSQKLSDN